MLKWFKKKKDKAEEVIDENIEQIEGLEEDIKEIADDIQEVFAEAEEVVEEEEILDDISETEESKDDLIETEELTNDLAQVEDSIDDLTTNLDGKISDEEISSSENELSGFNSSMEGESEEDKEGFFKSLFSGLGKTRKKIGDQIDNLINNYADIDEELYEEIEDILITADIGMDCTMELVENLKEELVKRKVKDPEELKFVLRDVMADYLKIEGKMELVTESPTIILVIGVNGAGKTTSIGKISYKLKKEGKKVILAAADTFRAAAIDQLKVWAERAEVGFVAHAEGSDPAAVIFDGIKAAQARSADVLICDTAGRLHNKVNLMNELNKMFRIIEREYPEANKEVLLVLDATTGQNALNQAKQFLESAGITGLVVTKLDGTAKGGFVFAIKSELGIPVKMIGVGEKIEDLQTFNPEAYANAVLNIE